MKQQNDSNSIPGASNNVFPPLDAEKLSVSLIIFEADDPYRLLNMNTSMLCELGYTKQTELERSAGISLLHLLHPDDCDSFISFVSAANESQAEHKCVCRLRRKDHVYLWFEVRLSGLSEAPDPTKVFCVCTNITEQVELEKEYAKRELQLRDAQAEQAAMIESLPGGWYICRLFNGPSLHYASDAFCQICGYTRKEIKELFSNEYVMLIHEEDRDAFINAIRELSAYPHNAELEYRIVHKNGSVIWVSDKLKSSRNREGLMFAYAVVTEIGKWHTTWKNVQSLVDTAPCGILVFEYGKSDGKVKIRFLTTRPAT